MNHYAYYRKGSTIRSIVQLSHFGLDIDNQSSVIPGHKPQMVTPDLVDHSLQYYSWIN